MAKKQYVEMIEVQPDGSEKVTKIEMSPEMIETANEMKKLAAQIIWCKCSAKKQQPRYYHDDDGSHGWECDRCGGLIQTG
jgi:predicted SprT family Zn-dependent metalloprotease